MAPSAAHRSLLLLLLLLCVVGSLICASSAQTCRLQNFPNKTFQSCVDLPVLNASLHWTYSRSNRTLDIAYRATPASDGGWVAWAINPTGSRMLRSQAIVGYVVSGTLNVITTSLISYAPSMQNESLSFPVSNLAGQSSGKDIILFATLTPPTNGSTVNQVWQTGPMLGGIPSGHPTTGANVLSMRTLDLLSGQMTPTSGSTPNNGTTLTDGTTLINGSTPTAGSPPTSGGNSKIRRKNVTLLANSFLLFDMIVLLSMLASYII